MASFSTSLYRWAEEHPRPMPWRKETDPYKIWISEMMLQQTRVEQVIGYYQRFLAHFPDVQTLANATEQAVLKQWEGLGYNSRARNLHRAAKQIIDTYQGVFPHTAKELKQLKGIGPYASSAIASFAFGEAVPVIDANVYRIAARITAMPEMVGTPAAEMRVRAWLDQVFDQKQPAQFNQAIMDFGALQCLPRKPLCTTCPFNIVCQANAEQTVALYPVKAPKTKRLELKLNYLVIMTPKGLVLRQRTNDEVWKGMYEFAEGELTHIHLAEGKVFKNALGCFKVLRPAVVLRQTLTHRLVEASFLVVEAAQNWLPPAGYQVATKQQIKKNFAVPGVIRNFLANFD
jgi:A/G-specific adenine glycosylase